MYKIGLSTCNKVINEELFVNYKNAGIEAIEISVGEYDYEKLDYKLISQMTKKYGIDFWSFHFPFLPFEGIDPSKLETKKHTVEYFTELIKKATDAGTNKFIIHSSGEPIDDSQRSERMKCAKDTLANLAEIASKEGAVIAVEDLPRTCLGNSSKEILELISLNDKLKVCFDTNHLLNENPVDFIKNLGDKIITTHVSDYDFTDEKHWLPGEGKVNWSEIFNALRDINYKGVWLYELGFICPDSMPRSRNLTCGDFVRNAKELFENKEITIVK